jgi:hypothetical protein
MMNNPYPEEILNGSYKDNGHFLPCKWVTDNIILIYGDRNYRLFEPAQSSKSGEPEDASNQQCQDGPSKMQS